MLTSFTSVWAQNSTGTGTPAPGGILIPAVGDDYRIAGEEKPELYKEYPYKRQMPAGSDDVYWHIEGAATINGDSAGTYPNGNLNAAKAYEIQVQWDDSATVRLLQLRRGDGEKVYVMAELLVRGVSISNKITYYGRGPGFVNQGLNRTITLCPNVIDPVTGAITGEPYHFQMESNCSGTSGNNCTNRPNFVWLITYFTANGEYIFERIGDDTQRDFSKVWLYMYSKALLNCVPNTRYTCVLTVPEHNVNLTTAYGNTNVFRWGTTSGSMACNPYVDSYGSSSGITPGDQITRVRIECTGYGCGVGGNSTGLDQDFTDIYYLGLPPAPINLVNSPATPLCRGQSYQVETAGAYGATGYTWTADNGAQVVGIPGMGSGRMTLNLANVPVTATNVTVTVSPATGSPICAGFPQTTTLVIPLSPAGLQPQNMALTNGLCAGTNTKTVSVDGSNPAREYEWSISGRGATFFGGSTGPLSGERNYISIVTNDAVPVTVTARRQITACGGYGPALSTTYQIISPTPVAPTGIALTWCFGSPRTIVLTGVQPGLTYAYQVLSIAPTGSGVTLTGGANGIGTTVQVTPDANGVYPSSFVLVVTASGPCSSAVQSSAALLYLPKKQMFCYPTGPRMAAPPVLYPNPTTGQVAITAEPNTTYAWAKVMNAQGQLMQEQKAVEDRDITSLDMSALPTGIYLVQLFDGQHLTTQRLVKE